MSHAASSFLIAHWSEQSRNGRVNKKNTMPNQCSTACILFISSTPVVLLLLLLLYLHFITIPVLVVVTAAAAATTTITTCTIPGSW